MKVRKSSKELVRFDRNKIIKTCLDAGTPLKFATRIASEVRKEGYDGMTTDEIRMRVYLKIKKISPEKAEQYVYRSNLKVRTSTSSMEYFQESKIVDSLTTETKVDRSFAQLIAKEVAKELGRLRLNYVTAPLIREIVNVKLLEHGMESVRARYTRLGMPVFDVKNLLENGSHEMPQYSPEAVHKVMSDQIAREYALINVLPVDLADAHMLGQIHIHDLNYFSLRPTTFSHDLYHFLRKGIRVDGTGEYTAVAGPARHASSAFMHALKVLIAGQTEGCREQYIEDFNYLLAPYVVGLSYDQVRQLTQMLFYEISQTSVGKGGQAIYACLVFDTNIPKRLKDKPVVSPGGKVSRSVTYSDFVDEANTLLEAVIDVSNSGDVYGKPFLYPKICFNVLDKSPDDLLSRAYELAFKFGGSYFLHKGDLFYGPRRGSIQHVTVNLAQLACLRSEDLFSLLENRMKKAGEVLLLKKKVMSSNLDNNLLPFLRQRAGGMKYFDPDKQLFVISYTGLNELCRMETGSDLRSREGSSYGLKVLGRMMKSVRTFSRESELDFILTGDPKGICYTRFAVLDASRFGSKAYINNSDNPYYSKSHYVSAPRISGKLRVEGAFNNAVNGRTLTQVRVGQGSYAPGEVASFTKKVMNREDVGFLNITRDLTICVKCANVLFGLEDRCPACKSRKVGVWSRDTGHLQNVRTWNLSQRQSYADDLRYGLDGVGSSLSASKKKLVLGL